MLGRFAHQNTANSRDEPKPVETEEYYEETGEVPEGEVKQKTTFEFEGGDYGDIMNEAYKAGNKKYVDKNAFR